MFFELLPLIQTQRLTTREASRFYRFASDAPIADKLKEQHLSHSNIQITCMVGDPPCFLQANRSWSCSTRACLGTFPHSFCLLPSRSWEPQDKKASWPILRITRISRHWDNLQAAYKAIVFVTSFCLARARPLSSACNGAPFKVTVSHLGLTLCVFLPFLSKLAYESISFGTFGEYLNISTAVKF